MARLGERWFQSPRAGSSASGRKRLDFTSRQCEPHLEHNIVTILLLAALRHE
jgi:hypothetical protein